MRDKENPNNLNSLFGGGYTLETFVKACQAVLMQLAHGSHLCHGAHCYHHYSIMCPSPDGTINFLQRFISHTKLWVFFLWETGIQLNDLKRGVKEQDLWYGELHLDSGWRRVRRERRLDDKRLQQAPSGSSVMPSIEGGYRHYRQREHIGCVAVSQVDGTHGTVASYPGRMGWG